MLKTDVMCSHSQVTARSWRTAKTLVKSDRLYCHMDALAAWVVFEACGPDFVLPVQTGAKTKKTKKKKSKKRKKKETPTPDNKKKPQPEPVTPTRRSSRIRTNHRLTYTSGVPRKHIKTQRCPVCLTFVSALRRTGICRVCNSKLSVQGTSIVVDLVSDGSDEEVDPKDKKKTRPLPKWQVPKLSDLKPGDAVSVRIPYVECLGKVHQGSEERVVDWTSVSVQKCVDKIRKT